MVIKIALIVVFVLIIMRWIRGNFIEGMSNVNNVNELGYTQMEDPYQNPYFIRNLLSKDECDKIIKYSSNLLVESHVVSGKDKSVRNSQQTWIKKDDVMIKDVIDRIIKIVGMPIDNAEDLQIVRYEPGQYYNEHHDSCCDANEHCKEFIRRGGQRALTVLIYLNDGFTDGETYFKNLNIKVKPNTGDAVVFYPLGQNTNKCHPKALHAGLPVKSGEKWIANLWFREHTFT